MVSQFLKNYHLKAKYEKNTTHKLFIYFHLHHQIIVHNSFFMCLKTELGFWVYSMSLQPLYLRIGNLSYMAQMNL